MAKYEIKLQGDLRQIVSKLDEGLTESSRSTSFVEESTITVNGVTVLTRVYDKYFIRASGRVSLTLTLVDSGEGTVYLSAISAAGIGSSLFNLFYNSEDAFIHELEKIINRDK